MKAYRTKNNTNERLSEIKLEKPISNSNLETISIDVNEKGQTILGFGGAFTEASAYNLSRVNQKVREEALKLYFDQEEGIGYTIGRVSIHGCDFSLNSYLYIEDYDDSLQSFSISRDQKIIEMIKKAEQYAKRNIKVLASPWTPPFWMKDNHSPIKGGKLFPSYYPIWANYFVKFIQAYQKEGINLFAVTIQNEPQAVQRWDSCIYSNEDEKEFVKVLGPTFEANGLQDIKILIWDHNRDVMVERAHAILSDPTAYQYVWGTAFHWYDNEQFDEVRKLHELYPEKHLLFTEGCQEGGPHFNEYHVGERYGRNMINDLRNYTEGYIDWNLFLDDTGGPNHVNNLCSSPLMLKIFNEEIVKMPAYYYIGHFSKFIKPGAKQLISKVTGDLLSVTFENSDGSKVIVIQNQSEIDINTKIIGLTESINLVAAARSITTLVL
jgi:glucosylceramidase